MERTFSRATCGPTSTSDSRTASRHRFRRPLIASVLSTGLFAGLPVLLSPPPAFAQPAPALTPDDQAMLQLNAARRAFDDGKFSVAAEQFKQFIAQHAGQKESAAASYGLGLSLLQLHDKDYPAITEALTRAAGAADLPDHALAVYYLGVAQRGAGNQAAARADAAAGRKAAQADRPAEVRGSRQAVHRGAGGFE